MLKRSFTQGVLTPETPEEDYGVGDRVLEQFNQLNVGGERKRQRIEVDSDSDDDISNDETGHSTAGIIQKIEVTNFMCHDHFQLELGPQINFIIGQNGSGKSAVLTAISVGLGAKANETNRGSSLKLLIKRGHTSSRVIITFQNEGPRSYKPEIFGKKIIVQRILKLEGSNKYSIRSELNRHISDKKLDLDAMLAAFGITVNNPMAILTQDAAKSFIATASDEEKFKFFMAGTKIDETIKNYNKTQQDLSSVREKLVELNTDMRKLKQLDADAKILYDRYESQEELLKMKTLYQGKFMWVQVQEKEVRLLKSHEGVSNFTEEIESARAHIDDKLKLNVQYEEDKLKFTELEIEHHLLRETAESELNSMMPQLQNLKSQLKDAEADIASTQREIDSDNNKIPRLQQQIKAEQERIDLVNGGSHDQLAQEKTTLELAIEVLKKDVSDLENERMTIRDKFVERKQQLEQELQTEHKTKQNIERQLHHLKNSEDKRLDAFGRQIYRILDEIERDAGYHRKPIGPLGRYVNLKQGEEKWSSLLESTLSKSLLAFVVQDQHDFFRLSSLFRKYKYNASIVTKRHEIFDFQSRSSSSRFKRVIDVLAIDDPFVECVLVDLNNINRIILESERQPLEQILRANTQNINSILVPYDRRSGNSLKMNKYGGLQIDVVHFRNDMEKIGSQGSSEEKSTRLQQSLAKVTRGIQIMESELRNLRNDQDSQILEVGRRASELKKQISRNQRLINDINNKLDESVDTGKLNALSEQITLIEKENQIREQLKLDCQLKYEELLSDFQKEQVDYKSKVNAIKKLRDKSSKFLDQISVLQLKIDTNLKEIKHYENSIEKRERYIADLNKYIDEESSVVSELISKAEQCDPRDEVELKEDDTMESIEADKLKIEHELNEFEKHVGVTREQLITRFQKTRENYKQAQQKIANAIELKEELQKSLQDRLMSFEQMRVDICSKVNDSFQKLLMLRQFTGKIVFDFLKSKLTMMVSTKKNELLRNIESFSGGEKSFSQIALLLAIWDFMNTKIRGLDEFDVFMDQVNRTLSLRLILEKIKNSPSQTIFITPLDIAGINGANNANVNIHKIADPKKN